MKRNVGGHDACNTSMDHRRTASIFGLVYNLSINLTQGHPCCGHPSCSRIKRFRDKCRLKRIKILVVAYCGPVVRIRDVFQVATAVRTGCVGRVSTSFIFVYIKNR